MTKNTKVNAAILIIGNEILSGRTQDTNTSTLANWLNLIGVKVEEVRVIPDIEKTIIDTLNFLRTTYDYIFTLYNPTAPSGYGAASSILGNPDMSSTKGRTYIDTIQGYLNPRMYVALNLAGQNSVNNVVDFTTNIYPNPAKNNITIENSNFVITNIKIYNITSQLVRTENVNSMSTNLNISDLKTGIYILELHTNETSIRRKLIIE